MSTVSSTSIMKNNIVLSIITINRNNADGLNKTMLSVLNQTVQDFEYIVIDGNSDDESIDVIKNHAEKFGERLKWISEPDKGIYNAMNKGIRRASGEYVQFLNSGDCLASPNATEKMIATLEKEGWPSILYGNMLKDMPNGQILRDRSFAGQDISFLDFYSGTLNHSPAYIKKSLFERYGMYDESLRIVSDWKWYLQAIVLGGEQPFYTDLDVTLFDMAGISESKDNAKLLKDERERVLNRIIVPAILADYKLYSTDIWMIKHLKLHNWAYSFVRVLERGLFKIDKWKSRCKKGQTC